MVYFLFRIGPCRVGILSPVYLFARGPAPLIVAIVSVVFLGEQMSHLGEMAGVLIALGVASLAMTRGAAGLREPRPVILALIASGFVGAYSIADALGARTAGSPHRHIVWISLLYS